jgi:putative membrane protein
MHRFVPGVVRGLRSQPAITANISAFVASSTAWMAAKTHHARRSGGFMHTTHLSRLATTGIAVFVASLGASVAAAQVTTTSGGDVSTFTQKNLVNHLIVGDSLEVEMAQLALTRSQNAAVKEFANQLITDHKAHLDNLNKLAGKSDIGREANPADTSGAHLAGILASLKSMPADSGFDQAFVQAQITHHQQTIDALKTMRAAAKDDDVQHDIDKTLPVLQNHLSKATQVAAQLSKPAMGMNKPPMKADSAATGAKPPVGPTPAGVGAKPPVSPTGPVTKPPV